MAKQLRPQTRAGFEVAIICALPIESDAIEALLDEDYEEDGFSYGKAARDENAYTIGRMANQHVVIAHMIGMGKINAATIAANLRFSFTEIKLGLVVGICGGAPKTKDGKDIYLGDVIVSTSVIQVDFGRQYPDNFVRRSGEDNNLVQTSAETRSLLRKLSTRSTRSRLTNRMFQYITDISTRDDFHDFKYPGASNDILHPAEHRHKHWNKSCPTCEDCQTQDDKTCELALKSTCVETGCSTSSDMVRIRARETTIQDVGVCTLPGEPCRPAIHFGTIACSDRVMRSAAHRDSIAANEGAIGFEMESAGAWNQFPTIVVKSVCDYADDHKDKSWQLFAALAAAACSKAVLQERRTKESLPDNHDTGAVSDVERGAFQHSPKPTFEDSSRSESQAVGYPIHWGVSRPRNTLFTGRDRILSDLQTIVAQATAKPSMMETCAIVITGMGGQGKSEISLQLAHRTQRQFWGIFWVDVSTTIQAENGFLSIAKQLKEDVGTWEDARQILANTKKPWLLILDNADDPETDYQEYFPTGSRGVVILTSRNNECRQYATTRWVDLKELSNGEACELLLRTARIPANEREHVEKDASEIASLLQSHALALIQAGCYVLRGHCTFKQYPQVFEKQKKRLLRFRPSQAQSRYGDVFTTFEASAEALGSMNTEAATDALELLSVLAFFSPARLPVAFFSAAWEGLQLVSGHEFPYSDMDELSQWHTSRLPSFVRLDGTEWDAFRTLEAIRLLQAFSLVTADTDSQHAHISMHPLSHVWAKERLDPKDQHSAWIMTGCLVATIDSTHPIWIEDYTQFRPHIQALIDWPLEFMFSDQIVLMVCRILVTICDTLIVMRSYEAGLELLVRLFTHLGLSQQHIEPEWAQLYERHGTLLSYHERGDEACLLLEQIIQISKETWGDNDPRVLAAQHRIGHVYRRLNKLKDAISILEDLVKADEQTLEPGNFDRLRTQESLGRAYAASGEHEKGIALLEYVVSIREQRRASDSPDHLSLQHFLATLYLDNGEPEKGIKLLEHVVRIREQKLAPENPSRIESQSALATAYLDNGEQDKSITFIQQVIGILEQKLAFDNQHLLSSKQCLGMAYLEKGDFDKSKALFEQIAHIRKKQLAFDDPVLLSTQHSLALLYLEMESNDEAARLLEPIVQIDSEKLQEQDSSRLYSEQALAQAYWGLGRHEIAFQMMQRVFKLIDSNSISSRRVKTSAERWIVTMEAHIRSKTSGNVDQASG